MLSIPFKKTDASIDVAGPLRRYLMKEFSKEEVEKYSSDLKELQSMRSSACKIDRASDAARAELIRYAAQLEALEAVFPVSETEVRVGFKWGDAFNPNKKSTQSTLSFERACVLYNIGAHESRSASEEDRTTEAGLKAACHRFQVAAGVFQHIKDRVVGGLVGTLTQDLIPDGLSAAVTLMLAQAQACFYEKAKEDRAKTKLKPNIIAKLAAKASEFYFQTLGFMQGPNLAPGLDKSWPAHVELQYMAFSAAAYHWESVSCHDVAEETGTGYGVEIAYLQKASDILEHAFRMANRNGLSTTFTHAAELLQGTVSKTLAMRLKDNRTVYMEPVPGQGTLKPVPGAGMVKTITFVPSLSAEDAHSGAPSSSSPSSLFEGLLSKSAKAALEDYKQKEAEELGALDGMAKEHSALARSQLAAVGLPGTVEAHQSVGGVPESVWKKVQAVKQGGGGMAELKDKIAELEASAERARTTMEIVEKTLDQDERLDEAFRRRYAGEYEGLSTADLAGDLRRDVEHYRGLWRTAREADKKVTTRLEDPSYREGLELLELDRKGLDAAMPAGKGAGAEGGGGEVDTAALSAKLVELAALLAEREAKMAELNDFVKNRNVAVELAKASRGGGGPEAYHGAVQSALSGLAPFRSAIDGTIKRQKTLVEEILAENERFQKARASDPGTLAREAFLQRIHGSVMLFHEVHAQLSEGAVFYSDLLQRLAQLNQTCEDLVYTQGLHRREFEVGYTHRRERALKEGEDASIELARQMDNQARVQHTGQGIQPQGSNAPSPPSSAYPGLGPGTGAASPSFSYSSGPTSALQQPAGAQQPPYSQSPQQYHPQQPHQGHQAQQPHQGYQAQQPHQGYQAQQPHQGYQAQQPYQGYHPQQPYQGYQGQQPHPQTYGYGQMPTPPQQHPQQYQPAAPHVNPGVHDQQASAPGNANPYGTGHNPVAGGDTSTQGTHTIPPDSNPDAASQSESNKKGGWGSWARSYYKNRTGGGGGDDGAGGSGVAGTQQSEQRPLPPVPTQGGDGDPKYRRLIEMGFPPERVRQALAETNGDENAAIAKLLEG